MNIIFKVIVSFLAYTFGLIQYKCFSFTSQNKRICLMYHKVLPSVKAKACEPGMYVAPQVFEMHLRQLLKRFHFCTLQEMCQFLSLKKFEQPSKPLCSLTFDDGWRDFYQFVFPLLVKYSIPATIFLPTSFIGTKKKFWTDSIISVARSLLSSEQVSVSKLKFCSQRSIEIHHLLLNDSVDVAIEKLKKEKINIIRDVLEDLYKMVPSGAPMLDERDFLSWDEIQEMQNSGFVQFGAHTHKHQILTTLDPDDIWHELVTSRDVLLDRGLVEPSFIPFCYPNGNYTDDIIDMVQAAGYNMAVTTERGFYQKGDSLFAVKRVGLHNDISFTVSLFLSRITGIL